MSKTPNPLHDTKAAANILGVEPCTLEARRIRGGGPAYVKIGRAVRYRESDLLEYIQQNLRTNTLQQTA